MQSSSLASLPLPSDIAVRLPVGSADIREENQIIKTYPLSGPDPVAVRAHRRDLRKIYPYFTFDDLAHEGVDQTWKVIRLENPYIEAFVLPEIGGKMVGAVEKSTGKDFIYYNKVLKFRRLAMRGPWASGGIQPNFGIRGLAPWAATPVDYLTRRNADGSVSCIVGTVDPPSRTEWRVEYTLHPDKAYIEVRSLWYNPQPLNQSYYFWMNAAQKLRDDLEFVMPGVSWIARDYSVPSESWPMTKDGRNLAFYRDHSDDDGHSYFVHGVLQDFAGGYWHDSQFGYGHWALHEEVPGQKLWLWPKCRFGSMWHGLLTDKDGPYFEQQTGRYLDQDDHEFLAPYSADRWRQLYFPYMKIGPMVKATPYGVLNVRRDGDGLVVGFCALQDLAEDLTVFAEGRQVGSDRIVLRPTEVYQKTFPVSIKDGQLRVDVGDKLSYTDDPSAGLLKRPFHFHNIDESSVEGLYQSAERDEKSRSYDSALHKYENVVQREPLHVRALTRLAELYCRRAQYEKALEYARKALDIAMYDADGNYIYGIIARRLGDLVDAKETLGWAARSMKYRSTAYCELGGIYLLERNFDLAQQYLYRSLSYDAYNIRGYQLLATTFRLQEQPHEAREVLNKILDIDPLCHFARFERYLLDPGADTLNNFKSMIRNEFPHEAYLEIAAYYANLRLDDDALQVLEVAPEQATVRYWQAYLLRKKIPERSREVLADAAELSPYLVFPFREESIPIFQWAATVQPEDWKSKYYLGLIYWGMQRNEDALQMLNECGDVPDYAPVYICRAFLEKGACPQKARADYERAYCIEKTDWRPACHLTNYYLESGMNDEALKVAIDAAGRFPKEEAVRTLLARTYLINGKYQDCHAVLAETSILPYEFQTDVYQMWLQSMGAMALADMRKGRYQEAIERLELSREFPEQLGTGKPADPDYRTQDYREVWCYEKLNMTAKAEEARRRIKAWNSRHPGEAKPMFRTSASRKDTAPHSRRSQALKRLRHSQYWPKAASDGPSRVGA
jgi:tetratricopeptide (TPR) repeat protein